MSVRKQLGKIKRKILQFADKDKGYIKKYTKYAFDDTNCKGYQQYEAAITRLYHTIEKGLSYENYRAGFGRENIEKILNAMEAYVRDGFDTEADFYKTALSALAAYLARNAEYGHVDEALNRRVEQLPGSANDCGGAFWYTPRSEEAVKKLTFEELLCDRHSIRHFSAEPVDLEKVKDAIRLAQHTPSACNRQGWRARIVVDKDAINTILKNQNGNTGFGREFDKIIVVTGDLRYFSRSRETYQVFIDGGMYAQNILNALHAKHIGSVPLSASLTSSQEANIRAAIHMDEAEVFILIIGIGSYPDKCLTAKSERHDARMQVI